MTEQQPIRQPTFNDLKYWGYELGLGQRIKRRYFIPNNPDKSVRRHERLGTPLIRRVIMSTVGRNKNKPNYRLDKTKPEIDAAAEFAFQGSVTNEKIHTVFSLPTLLTFVNATLLTSSDRFRALGLTLQLISGVAMGANMSLVALQRYNRARMMQRINSELAKGEMFDPKYKSWTGVNNSAIELFRTSERERRERESNY